MLIGLAAGWLAGQLTKGRGFGVAGNLFVGVVGALFGGFIFNLVGLYPYSIIGALIMAVVGSLALLSMMNAMKSKL